MNENPYQQGGMPQGGYAPNAQEQRPARQKKDKINNVELTGLVEPRGRNQEIKVFTFPNGGAAVHINLKIQEATGKSDENGFPRMRTTYIPVSIRTNKIIPLEQLRSIAIGMKVHVVGRLNNTSYEDKRGEKRTSLEVDVYVLEILEMPMQQAAPYAAQPYQQPQPGQGMPYGTQPYPQVPAGQQYPPQYAQPQPGQGMPYGAQPYQQAPAGQPYPPQYAQPQPGQSMPYAGQPYIQAPAGQQAAPPAYQPQVGRQYNDPNDLPPDGNINI